MTDLSGARKAAADSISDDLSLPYRDTPDLIANRAIDAFLADLLKSHAVVPREATEEMLRAGGDVSDCDVSGTPLRAGEITAREVYAAMIAAAESPAPPSGRG